MRELKFRAWLNNEKKYVIPIAIYFAENIEPTKIDYIEDGKMKSVIKTQFELEQYTGLKDKNGRQIYEGDIIKHKSGQTLSVYWREVGEWWAVFAGKLVNDYITEHELWRLNDCSEVIGNIHENPELLGGEE